MILPLNLLIGNKSNRYQLSVACMRRARQLSLSNDKVLEDNYGKVVSTSVSQILTQIVRYEISS